VESEGPEGLRKIMKSSQDSWCPIQDVKWAPPKCKSGALPFEPTSTMGFNIVVCVSCISDHVGGRTLTIPMKVSNLQTEQFDVGGQWVSSSQPCILRLLQELNLHTYPQYSAGYKVGLPGAGVFEKYSSGFPYFGSYYSCYELRHFVLKVSFSVYLYSSLTEIHCLTRQKYAFLYLEIFLYSCTIT
jgi:hypothetical protein